MTVWLRQDSFSHQSVAGYRTLAPPFPLGHTMEFTVRNADHDSPFLLTGKQEKPLWLTEDGQDLFQCSESCKPFLSGDRRLKCLETPSVGPWRKQRAESLKCEPPSCTLDFTIYNPVRENNSSIFVNHHLLALKTKSGARKIDHLDKIFRKFEGLSSSPASMKTQMYETVHACNPCAEEVETGGPWV